MAPQRDPLPRLLLVGGKGGVGKTTLAAAAAVYLSRTWPQRRILLASTGPTASLSDVMQVPVRHTPLPCRAGLWTVALDGDSLLHDFCAVHRADLHLLLRRGTPLDDADIDMMMALPVPGAQEVMALLEVAHLLRRHEYDAVVLDTAATGHTLRMLDVPHVLARWIDLLHLMQEKHHYLVRHMTRRDRTDWADRFLAGMTRELASIRQALNDSTHTEFMVVTVPEAVIVDETRRLFDALQTVGVRVRRVVVNRVVTSRGGPCCDVRRRLQEEPLRRIAASFAGCIRTFVSLQPRPVGGLPDLEIMGRLLYESGGAMLPPARPPPQALPVPSEGLMPADLRQLEFVLFVGKGGVGKTTLATATALELSKAGPGDDRVLLVSTDPAHSVGDVLDQEIGAVPEAVRAVPMLDAMEMDATSMLDDLKRQFRELVEETFAKARDDGVEVRFDRELIGHLLDLSPPGLDEMMALQGLIELRECGRWRPMVIDTAPGSHAVSLLGMPAAAERWLLFMLRVLHRYPMRSDVSELFARLVHLRGAVHQIHAAFLDPRRTAVVMASAPEPTSVMETDRLLESFQAVQVPCRQVLFNKIAPAEACTVCASRRALETAQMEAFASRAAAANVRVAAIPLLPDDLRAPPALERLAKSLLVPAGGDASLLSPQGGRTA